MPEISDQELALLSGSKKVLDKMLNNPKTKYQAEQLIKTNYPEAQTTVDRAAPFINRMNAIEQKLDKYMGDNANRDIDQRLNGEFDALRRQHYTEEGIESIKKLMVEKRISSPLDAAKIWQHDHPPTPIEPSVFQPDSWGFNSADGADDDMKLLWANEDRWADKEAGRALADYRRVQRRGEE